MLTFRQFDAVMAVIETSHHEELEEIIRMIRDREEMLRIDGERASLLSKMAYFRNHDERVTD